MILQHSLENKTELEVLPYINKDIEISDECQILKGNLAYLAALVFYRNKDLEKSIEYIDFSIRLYARNLNRYLIPIKLIKSLVAKTDILFHLDSKEWTDVSDTALSIMNEYLSSDDAIEYHSAIIMMKTEFLERIEQYEKNESE